jgi:transposase
MLGSKQRHFASLINVSLEELVPQNHFYRHLERMLNLSFVRELVQEAYASKGRPSVDPVVFFKLQLVMFFEGIRSERQLMRHAADRLSVRWYLDYDLGEPLPDHSSLTKIRCTGYLAHPFGKSRCKKERICLHWLQMDVQRGYNVRM